MSLFKKKKKPALSNQEQQSADSSCIEPSLVPVTKTESAKSGALDFKAETVKTPEIISGLSANVPLLSIRDLTYSYANEKHALNGVSLDIREGEKIAVLGANGAGKSTFFLNINGVLTADSGTIALKGQTMTKNKKDLNTLREHIGIVFQDADNQIIAATVKSEVSFGPMNLPITEEEVIRRTSEAMEVMDITKFSDRAPHYLSGGEKKRVAIADIIAMHPDLFIFDEPTAALDPAAAQMLEDTLHKISKTGKTMLISTHDVDFAYRWADRIIVFKDGSIIADDKPEAVFRMHEVLESSNLKKPVLMQVMDDLKAGGIVPAELPDPKSVSEFTEMTRELTGQCRTAPVTVASEETEDRYQTASAV
ncbi:MAG: energy-coupling factor ABC transporter ATP-binding protein [Eubacteriaceae bacterium]